MYRIFSTFVLLALFCPIAVADETCPIFPVPKEYQASGECWKLTEDGKLAIVVADKATAEQLRQKAARWKSFSALPANQLMPYNEQAGEDDLKRLFATYGRPPVKGKRLVEIEPKQWLPSTAVRGPYLVGAFDRGGVSCVGIGLPGHTATTVGDFGQLRLSVPVPKHDGKLVAQLFVADTRIDDKYRNVRTLSLFVNGRPVWEQDIALDQRGKEWIELDLTEMAKGAKTLDFIFTVLEKQAVWHHSSTVFLGPLVLGEVK